MASVDITTLSAGCFALGSFDELQHVVAVYVVAELTDHMFALEVASVRAVDQPSDRRCCGVVVRGHEGKVGACELLGQRREDLVAPIAMMPGTFAIDCGS